ncbi:MAG: hypothetical protein JWP33_2822 [Blastococcus sp.]|jgi:hypothetical protein|nr:hypothetical protein [Blastococcus sp.]
MSETASAPTSIRRLDTKDATRLARLVMAYDDLQTVLRCCERLMTMLDGEESADDVGVEALWTLALLSYARGFAEGEGGAALTTKDLTGGDDDGEILRWHRVLLHLRDQHADQLRNPRESYTVGIAQDASGAVNAVAVTSARAPLVDSAAVRRAGALAFPLCAVLDERIDPLQKDILADMRNIGREQLERLHLVEVAAVT